MAKTFQFDEYGKGQNANCVACEELLADALDGVLSPADQAFFDQHLLGCAPCTNAFAEAQRGAAWLAMLKSPPPEPSADLADRIIARIVSQSSEPAPANQDRLANVIPFAPRPAGRSRFAHFVRVMHEPRLAMTAAMAFFSIALTLNLTGVRLDQIHTANFSPTSLKRSYYEANASAVRYYDNLKVVRVLESRVDDIRQSNDKSNDDARTPESQPAPQPRQNRDARPQPKPESGQPGKPKPEVPRGSSRRESPLPVNPLLRTAFDPLWASPHFTSWSSRGVAEGSASPTPARNRAALKPSTPYRFKQEGGLA